MYLEERKIVFDTGKVVPCLKEMFSITENGIFKTLGPDHVVHSHHLNKKEKRELVNFMLLRIDQLIIIG